ncbi:MAG: ester cyclase [Candidatus Promineifilaceae bacterium]
MSVENTRKVMEHYFAAEHDDVSDLADDVVFTIMGTGQEHVGPQAVLDMLHYFYRQAFNARAETTNIIIGDGRCCLEAMFRGEHTGEFAGVPATGREVNVPLCVVYDLEDDKIKRGRVYFETPIFLAEVGALPD